jgi:hypothetical protein
LIAVSTGANAKIDIPIIPYNSRPTNETVA